LTTENKNIAHDLPHPLEEWQHSVQHGALLQSLGIAWRSSTRVIRRQPWARSSIRIFIGEHGSCMILGSSYLSRAPANVSC